MNGHTGTLNVFCTCLRWEVTGWSLVVSNHTQPFCSGKVLINPLCHPGCDTPKVSSRNSSQDNHQLLCKSLGSMLTEGRALRSLYFSFSQCDGEFTGHLSSSSDGRIIPLQLIMFYISCCASSLLTCKLQDAFLNTCFAAGSFPMVHRKIQYIWAWSISPGFSDPSLAVPILPFPLPFFPQFYHFSSIPDFCLPAFAAQWLLHLFEWATKWSLGQLIHLHTVMEEKNAQLIFRSVSLQKVSPHCWLKKL